MDLGNEQQMNENLSAASGGRGGSQNQTGGDSDDIYQSFVQSSQPRGLSAIQRAIQNTVQRTKNYLSQPTNKRGILGSIIGGALLGPFGAFIGGSLGQRYGGGIQNSVTDFLTGGSSPYGDTIPFTNPRFETQFTMPVSKPNIPSLTDGGITTLRNLPGIENQMADLNIAEKRAYDTLKGIVDAVGSDMLNDQQKQQLQELEQKKNQSGLGSMNFIV
jgi:hypothetical protein